MTVLGKVNRAKFPGRAVAGDRIDLEVTIAVSRPEGTLCEGTAHVDGKLIAEAEFMIVLLPPEMTPPPDERRANIARAIGLPPLPGTHQPDAPNPDVSNPDILNPGDASHEEQA